MLKGSLLYKGDAILTKFKLIQAFIVVLLICKDEEDQFRIESTSSPIISLWGFFHTLKGMYVIHKSLVGSCLIFNPFKILWVVLLTCKNKEDPIKNEGARVVTTLFVDFSEAQGQLTPKSAMESCQNSNSSELLWLVLLLARMRTIHPKMKVLEWSQHFLQYKSMGIFLNAQGQLTHKSLV